MKIKQIVEHNLVNFERLSGIYPKALFLKEFNLTESIPGYVKGPSDFITRYTVIVYMKDNCIHQFGFSNRNRLRNKLKQWCRERVAVIVTEVINE